MLAGGLPPPPGRVWMMVAVGDRAAGTVVVVSHDLPTPSARALHWVDRALVPEDGGPAPGRKDVPCA